MEGHLLPINLLKGSGLENVVSKNQCVPQTPLRDFRIKIIFIVIVRYYLPFELFNTFTEGAEVKVGKTVGFLR